MTALLLSCSRLGLWLLGFGHVRTRLFELVDSERSRGAVIATYRPNGTWFFSKLPAAVGAAAASESEPAVVAGRSRSAGSRPGSHSGTTLRHCDCGIPPRTPILETPDTWGLLRYVRVEFLYFCRGAVSFTAREGGECAPWHMASTQGGVDLRCPPDCRPQ
jgi:hypothetical protein